MKKKKILVTGGSGFVGTNLLKRLSAENNFLLYSNYFKNKKFKKVTNVKYFKVDLEKLQDCKKICKNIDIIIMCAANSSGAAIMEKKPLVHLSPNIRMNINMAEAAYEAKVKKFIFISSNTVYPQVNFPVKEKNASFNFFDKYYVVGWMKRFSEIVMNIYGQRIKKNYMKTIIVRPGNLYGAHDKFDPIKSKVIPSLIRKVVKKQNPLTVWGDGKDLKDFLYIDDFTDAMLKIIKNINNSVELNIASGKGHTIREVLNLILKIEQFNPKINFDRSMPTMIPKRLIDIAKAKKIISFKPKISIEEGLKRTILWYKKHDN
jgi:GDP-L-fucose synthase